MDRKRKNIYAGVRLIRNFFVRVILYVSDWNIFIGRRDANQALYISDWIIALVV